MTERTDPYDVLAGRFWRADSDHGVPGRLTFAEGISPRLELDEPLIPFFREVEREQSDGTQPRVYAETPLGSESLLVHGALDDGTPVTLLDATESKRRVGGESRQWLGAHLALIGGHVSGRDEPYTRIRLQVRHLADWAALPGFDPDEGRRPLASHRTGLSPVALQDGGQLDLEEGLEAECSELGGGRIGREAWFRLVDLPPMTADDLDRRFVTPLSSLLTLATGTRCPPVAVEVATGSDQPWLRMRHAGLRLPAEEARSPHRQLLPRPTFGLNRVAAWLDAVEELGPLPPVVAGATKSEATLETELLDLTTVAEGLHQRLFRERRRLSSQQAEAARTAISSAISGLDEEVRRAVEGAIQHLEEPSFPQRLMQLADRVEPAMPGVTGRTNRWKHHVADIRNAFAHRSYGFLGMKRVGEMVAVLESLRWLLTGLLLLRTGLDPAELAARVQQHEPFVLFRQQACEWLPRVFEAPAVTREKT